MKAVHDLRVLSYNIHKGFSGTRLRFVLSKIKESIRQVDADLVLLQEVLGHHESDASQIEDWPTQAQFEFLADSVWKHFAYGKNAVYSQGHHGNAILSRYPISSWENIDVSPNRLERRGLLHAGIEIPGLTSPCHVVCLHLGLFEADRDEQLKELAKRIDQTVPRESPLIIGGDFNDWREKASDSLERRLGVQEAFLQREGSHAKTFPSWLPALRLDRIYFRNAEAMESVTLRGKPWTELSDHLPIFARLSLHSEAADPSQMRSRSPE